MSRDITTEELRAVLLEMVRPASGGFLAELGLALFFSVALRLLRTLMGAPVSYYLSIASFSLPSL